MKVKPKDNITFMARANKNGLFFYNYHGRTIFVKDGYSRSIC